MLFGSFEKNFPPLSDKMRSSLRKRFSEVETITVIEILMVSNDVFFAYPFLFGRNLPVGKMFLLQEWQSLQLGFFTVSSIKCKTLLWGLFKITEVKEVTRQCGDDEFIGLLNHVRTAQLNDCDLTLCKSKLVDSPSDTHIMTMLESIDNELCSLQTIDGLPKNVH